MKIICQDFNSYRTSKWAGGTTTETFIYPQDTRYDNRNFDFRLSFASSTSDYSNFTKLDSYNRHIWLTEGESTLVHKESSSHTSKKLQPFEVHSFKGKISTEGFGNYSDYNIMVKDNLSSIPFTLSLAETSNSLGNLLKNIMQHSKISEHLLAPRFAITLFLKGEYGILESVNKSTLLKSDSQVIIFAENKEDVTSLDAIHISGCGYILGTVISLEGTSRLMHYDPKVKNNYCFSEEKTFPKERAHLSTAKSKTGSTHNPIFRSNFFAAFYLCNTNFRGAKYLVKSKKFIFPDRVLYPSLDRLEKSYLSEIIAIIGSAIAFALCGDVSLGIRLAYAIGWLFMSILLFNPLLYMALLPKPLKNHILDIRKMPEGEREKIFELQSGNPHLERLLKKYSFSGRYYYDEDGNRINNLKG